ncbi:expressed protein, partial [Phakopsora pachyrhizi]
TRLVTEPEAERETPMILESSHLKIVEPNKNLQFSKSLIKIDSTRSSSEGFPSNVVLQRKNNSPIRRGSMNKSDENQNNSSMTPGAGKEKGKEKVISVEAGKSLDIIGTNLNSQNALIMTRKSSKISSTEKSNPMKTINPIQLPLNRIKNLLSVKINKSGPFDLEGKREYSSPYNRHLLDFLEKNLKILMPKELDDFEFSHEFLENIKVKFWKKDLGIFLINEESVLNIMTYFDSQTKNGKSNWIKISAKGLKTYKNTDAFNCFSFRAVFKNFINFEVTSRFFFTEKICQRSITFFTELNSKLSMLKDVNGESIKRSTVESILNLIWNGMSGFLAHVHAINAIIKPSKSLLPLSQEELVAKQEQAFEFFCELHKDIENFRFKQRTRKSTRAYATIRTGTLSFEQIREHSLDQLINTRVYSHHAAWIYIELWLTKCRPKLQEINCRFSYNQHFIKRSKFKSLLNRVCFIFFSGMVKHGELEREKLRGKELQI